MSRGKRRKNRFFTRIPIESKLQSSSVTNFADWSNRGNAVTSRGEKRNISSRRKRARIDRNICLGCANSAYHTGKPCKSASSERMLFRIRTALYRHGEVACIACGASHCIDTSLSRAKRTWNHVFSSFIRQWPSVCVISEGDGGVLSWPLWCRSFRLAVEPWTDPSRKPTAAEKSSEIAASPSLFGFPSRRVSCPVMRGRRGKIATRLNEKEGNGSLSLSLSLSLLTRALTRRGEKLSYWPLFASCVNRRPAIYKPGDNSIVEGTEREILGVVYSSRVEKLDCWMRECSRTW